MGGELSPICKLQTRGTDEQRLNSITRNAGAYEKMWKADSYISDFDTMKCLLIRNPNLKSNPVYKKTVKKILIRYLEKLVKEKRFEEAIVILEASQRGGTPSTINTVADLAQAVNFSDTSDVFDATFDYSFEQFEFQKGEIYKGAKKYQEAIKYYKSALRTEKNPNSMYWDYQPYSKISLLEAMAEAGYPLSEILDEARKVKEMIVKYSSSNTQIDKNDFYQRMLNALANAYAKSGMKSKNLEHFKIAESLYRILNGESVFFLGDISGFKTSFSPNAPGKFGNLPAAIANMMIEASKITSNIKDWEEAQKYCMDNKIYDRLVEILWAKINLRGKDAPASLPDRLMLVVLYKTSLGNASNFAAEPWKAIKAMSGLPTIPNLKSGDPLKDRLNLAVLLDSIASISRKSGSANRYDPELFKRLADSEYASCEKPILSAIGRRPADAANYLRLAVIYERIGNSFMEVDPKKGREYLSRAGYILQKVLNGDIEFPADNLGIKIFIDSNADKLQISLPADSKERYLALLSYANIALRGKLAVSSDPNEIVPLYNKIIAKYNLVQPKVSGDKDLDLSITSGKMEANRIYATALINLSRPEEALAILEKNIKDLLSGDKPDYPAALGNISILAWAYETIARKSNDKTFYVKATALYQALLYGQSSNIADIIVKNRANLLSDNSIKLSGISMGQLYLSYGRALFNIGRLENAGEQYKRALSIFNKDASPEGQARAAETRLAQSELIAKSATILIEKGSYKEALDLISKEDLAGYKLKIEQLIENGSPEIIYNAATTLAWIYGLKSKIQDKLYGEGAGKESYLAAVSLYKDLEAKTTDDLLFRMNTSRTGLILTIAGYLQAAGANDADLLAESLVYYNKALSSATVPADRAGINLGRAEVLIKLNHLKEAFDALQKAFADLNSLKFNNPDQALRFIRALSWGLSAKENQNAGGVFPEKESVSMAKRLLQSGVSNWKIHLEYLRILLSAKMYDDAVSEYHYALDLIGRQTDFTAAENEILVSIHASIGEVFCYKINRCREARNAFDRAQKLIESGDKDNKFTLAARFRLLNGYAQIAANDGDYDKALDQLKQVISHPMFVPLLSGDNQAKVDPEFIKILISSLLAAGNIYKYRLKNAGEAVKYYRLARFAAGIIDDRKAPSPKNAAGPITLEFRAAYARDIYHGEKEDTVTNGFVPTFNAGISITPDLKLNMNYNLGLPREPGTQLSIGRQHNIIAGANYNYEGDSYNFRITPSFIISTAGYTLNKSTTGENKRFHSEYLGITTGLDYKHMINDKLLLMPGFDATASIRLIGSGSPLNANDADSYGIERLSLGLNPHVLLNRGKNTISFGGGLEYVPLDITVNGLWPLDKEKGFWRYYVSAGLDAALHFGKGKRWSIPLQFNGKFGNMLYAQGGAGIGYTGDGRAFRLMFDVAHFNDNIRSENTTYTLNLQASF